MSEDLIDIDGVRPGEEGYVIKVGKLPGTIKEVSMNGENTVADVLSQADLDPAGYEIRLNGSPASLNDNVHARDTVLLVRKIQGNVIIPF